MKLKYLLTGLIAIIILTVIILYTFGDNWAESKLHDKITKIDNLKYDTLQVTIAERKVIFKGLSYQATGIDLKAKSVEINGIKIYSLLLSDEIKVNDIFVDGAQVEYHLTDSNSGSKAKSKKPLPDFEIQHIKIDNSALSVTRAGENTPFLSSDFGLALGIVDQGVVKNMRSALNCIEEVGLSNIKYRTKDSLYVINARNLAYGLEKNAVNFDSINVKCIYEKYNLGHVIGHEIDWVDFNLASGSIHFVDLDTLITHRIVKSIRLDQPTLNVFRDKRLPFPEDQRPKLIQEILSDTSLSFKIDSIEVVDADITYEEFVKEAKGPGTVSFNKLNGLISNFSTYDQKSTTPPRLVAKCDLLNESKLYADISFPLSAKGETIIKGKLEPMDLTAFNQMVQYVAFTKIRKGYLRKLDFDFSYNNTDSHGTMNFAYENLKIDFLNKQESEPEGVFNHVKSFVANTFVVDSKNAYDSGKFRVGKIAFERNIEKSMFNFWWNSILTGFRSSTGVNASGEKIDVN